MALFATADPVVRITYQVEPFAACVFEIKQHVPAHWEEIASLKNVRKLDIDWETYLQADRLGRMVLATARANGRLLGYVAMMQRNDLHSRRTQVAESAFYFVEKRYMRGLIMRNLIRFVCHYLQEKGVHYIRFRNKFSHSNEPILRKLGFTPDEMVYSLK